MPKETIRVNAFNLSDKQISALSTARLFGLTSGKGEVDRIADAGAQLIQSFGKEYLKTKYTDGLLFELTIEEIAIADAIILGVLANIDFYRVEENKLYQGIDDLNKKMLDDRLAMIEERKNDFL